VLFNRDGQVIGLLMPGPWQRNDQITANVLGISDLFPIIQILVNGDPVPYLGVEGITITEELSAAFEIPPGVYVRQILGDSPAMNGRIHNGDVIIAVNGYEVLNKESLVSSILSSDIGMTIEVTVKRRGAVEYEIMTLPVIIGNRD
jgi:serine protease Do